MGFAPTQSPVEVPSHGFYRGAMDLLTRAGIPFMVGGAFAFVHQTGIDRSTKDLDIFVRPIDVPRILEAGTRERYKAELVFSHWLAKIKSEDNFIDVIFSSGNGIAAVDDRWFEHATRSEVLGLSVLIAPVEETLWSKAFVMERERYDGADVAHILLARGDTLDWSRLLERFGSHWRVLLSHLILFGFIFPSHRSRIPAWVLDELLGRLAEERTQPDLPEAVCYGTLLSWAQYLGDVLGGEFRDARIRPWGTMTAHEVARWTAADKEKS